MKTKLLILTSFLLANIAHSRIEFGDHIVCQKKLGEFSPKLQVQIIAPPSPYRTNGLVTVNVSIWGHSRNTYSASYLTPIEAAHDRIGYAYYLNKHKDFSTWEDMPQKFSLYALMGGSFVFKGQIPGKGFVNVYLDEDNCLTK